MMFGGMFHNPGNPMPHMGAPEEEFLDASFSIEPIEAWRAWSIELHSKRGLYLKSVTHNMRWPRRIPARAHCFSQLRRNPIALAKHTAPSKTHHCGIHSVKKILDAKRWLMNGSQPRVIGKVKIWGRVLNYEKGYLSEYAYPFSPIYLSADEQRYSNVADGAGVEELSFMLQDAYGVDVYIGFPEEPED